MTIEFYASCIPPQSHASAYRSLCNAKVGLSCMSGMSDVSDDFLANAATVAAAIYLGDRSKGSAPHVLCVDQRPIDFGPLCQDALTDIEKGVRILEEVARQVLPSFRQDGVHESAAQAAAYGLAIALVTPSILTFDEKAVTEAVGGDRNPHCCLLGWPDNRAINIVTGSGRVDVHKTAGWLEYFIPAAGNAPAERHYGAESSHVLLVDTTLGFHLRREAGWIERVFGPSGPDAETRCRQWIEVEKPFTTSYDPRMLDALAFEDRTIANAVLNALILVLNELGFWFDAVDVVSVSQRQKQAMTNTRGVLSAVRGDQPTFPLVQTARSLSEGLSGTRCTSHQDQNALPEQQTWRQAIPVRGWAAKPADDGLLYLATRDQVKCLGSMDGTVSGAVARYRRENQARRADPSPTGPAPAALSAPPPLVPPKGGSGGRNAEDSTSSADRTKQGLEHIFRARTQANRPADSNQTS